MVTDTLSFFRRGEQHSWSRVVERVIDHRNLSCNPGCCPVRRQDGLAWPHTSRLLAHLALAEGAVSLDAALGTSVDPIHHSSITILPPADRFLRGTNGWC